MQPSSIQIKHRCSEVTFALLTVPYYITCLLKVGIFSLKSYDFFTYGLLRSLK